MTRRPDVRGLTWAGLLWAVAAAAALAQDTGGPDPVAGLGDLTDAPAALINDDQIARMIETALQGDADALQRVVARGAQADLAEPVAEALANALSDRLKAGDRLAASRIETAVALYGSVVLADTFNATLATRTAQTPAPGAAEKVEPAEATTKMDGPAPPGARRATGLASHGAPIREMGPTH